MTSGHPARVLRNLLLSGAAALTLSACCDSSDGDPVCAVARFFHIPADFNTVHSASNLHASLQEQADTPEKKKKKKRKKKRHGTNPPPPPPPAPPTGPLDSGDVMVVGGALSLTTPAGSSTGVAEYFDAGSGTFGTLGAPQKNGVSRVGVVLGQGPLAGKALLAGGMQGTIQQDAQNRQIFRVTGPVALQTGEIYDEGQTAPLVDTLESNKIFHTETPLPNGKVLIPGGFNQNGGPLRNALLFDPQTSTFGATGEMATAHALHTATLLPGGKVLVAFGFFHISGFVGKTAEVYDPVTELWSAASTEPAPVARAGHTATLISGCNCALDGKVLIVGGFTNFTIVDPNTPAVRTITSVLVYDPVAKTFSADGIGQLTEPRALHSAALLPGGKVLIAGGVNGSAFWSGVQLSTIGGGVLKAAEIFDPATKSFTCVGGEAAPGRCAAKMTNARAGHSATLMTTGPRAGQVLLAGGFGGAADTQGKPELPLATAEVFAPATGTFTATWPMRRLHAFHAAIPVQ